MADRYWVGNSGNWSEIAHWSTSTGGSGEETVPGISDTAIINGDSGTGLILADTAIDTTIDFQVTQQLSFNSDSQTITLRGNSNFLSNGTGALTINSLLTLHGDNTVVIDDWSAETLTGMSVDIKDNGTISNAMASTTTAIKAVTGGYSGKTAVMGGAKGWLVSDQLTWGPGKLSISAGAACYLRTVLASPLVPSDGSAILGGTSNHLWIDLATGGASPVIFPAMTVFDAITLYVRGYQGANRTIDFAGALIMGNQDGNNLVFENGATMTGSLTVNTNNYAITTDEFHLRSDKLGQTCTINLGSSVITCKESFEVNDALASPDNAVVNAGTSQIVVAVLFWIGTNVTWNNGGSITFRNSTLHTGAATITSAGKTLPAITVDKATAGLTQSDALTCGNLTLTDGTYDMDGFALSCADLLINTTDTKTLDATITASGNVTINQTTTISRLIMTVGKTLTIASGKTLSITGYIDGDLDDINISGGTLTLPARSIVTGVTATGNTATNEIDATDSSNTNGGGNTNWNFGNLSVSNFIVNYLIKKRKKYDW